MSITDLVNDDSFNPDNTGVGDPNPLTRHLAPHHRARLVETLRCQVTGCNTNYAPQGVCGYCRARVKQIRSGFKVAA